MSSQVTAPRASTKAIFALHRRRSAVPLTGYNPGAFTVVTDDPGLQYIESRNMYGTYSPASRVLNGDSAAVVCALGSRSDHGTANIQHTGDTV